jgi:serine/threonine-protein kinase
MRSWLVISVIALAVPVHAETDAERAKRLFDEGRELAGTQAYEAAYDKFAESFRLDPALGTELNLADSLEHLGRVLGAWSHYDHAATELERAGKPQAKFARDRATALGAKLGTVVVVVLDDIPAGTAVTIAGRPVDAKSTITERVEPGEVEVVAEAPGVPRVVKHVTVPAGASMRVEVPLAIHEREGRRAPGRVHLAQGLVGVGAASLITSVAFIFVAHSDYNNTIHDPNLCPFGAAGCKPDGLTAVAHAQHLSDASTAFFVVGAGLAAAGAVVYLTAPREEIAIVPTGAGVAIRGRF